MENRNPNKKKVIGPATRAFFREAENIPGFSLLEKIHGYVYGRWPYFYIGVGTGRHPLTRWLAPLVELVDLIHPTKPGEGDEGKTSWADSYHGKVVPLQEATKLIQVNRDIEVRNLEHVLPYTKAKDIVLKHPDHIVALDCPCRSSLEKHCEPLDVCLIVGEPFASFIHEHHPDKSRPITQDEAVAILKAEDERGHVHHVFFKEAMLDRYYAICNCCECCCGAMQAHRNGIPMLCSSGYVAVLDKDLCVDCGLCAKKCQFKALGHENKVTTLDTSKCMGCGICVNTCPVDALHLERNPSDSAPLEVDKILEMAT